MLIDVYEQGEKYYRCADFYKPANNFSEWLACPKCGLKPLIWEFDNGRSTACGCGKDSYDHFTIRAESINSIVSRDNGSVRSFDPYELRDNWNHWCETGEVLFLHASERTDGRW